MKIIFICGISYCDYKSVKEIIGKTKMRLERHYLVDHMIALNIVSYKGSLRYNLRDKLNDLKDILIDL